MNYIYSQHNNIFEIQACRPDHNTDIHESINLVLPPDASDEQ